MERREANVENALLHRDVEELTSKVEKLSNDVESLLAAWQTAMHVVGFVKWLASIGAAVAAVWVAVKGLGR